jgi:D-glycero-D-manno-heptose 1,7-bisphosphate phosphatase
MHKAIFLDRDGVIIENRDGYVLTWADVEFLPGALEALAKLKNRGYKLFIVTNQSAVGRGLLSFETANAINLQLMETIQARGGQVDGIYMCPHAPEADCLCRKPRPGLLLQAATEHALDLSRSWMVGDAWSDLQAGVRAGAWKVGLVKTGRGTRQLGLIRPHDISEYFIFNDLAEALAAITDQPSNH